MKISVENYCSLKLIFFFSLFYLHIGTALSQEKTPKDTTNFFDYSNKIMLRANLSSQDDSFILNDKKGSDLYLETNNSYKTYLAVNYKFIGFSFGFYPKFFSGNTDEEAKGKSTFKEFNLQFFLKKWLVSLHYNKTRGYYVANTYDFDSNWTAGVDPYILFPNLKSEQYSIASSYIFNPKFSYKSITSYAEWQKKSAGSFVPSMQYEYNKISLGGDPIDSEQKENDFRLVAGYYYNFIIRKNFFIAANLSPSVGVKFMESKEVVSGIQKTENEIYFAKFLDGGLKVGYNSETIYLGSSLNFNESSYSETKNKVISNNKLYAYLYFGYRFDAPSFVKKPVETIEKKIHLN
nr:DUF4421 family protein [uncultured Flavobacterium sp.]